MITRRDFGLLTGGAGLTLVTAGQTNAQGISKIRLANAAGIIDSQIIFMTVGMHPKLGFYRDEKIDWEIINMSGVAQTMQSTTTGTTEVASVSPLNMMNVWVKNKDLDLLCVYCWLRQVAFGVAVKPDSPIRTIGDLKGKKIGIRNQGDTGYIGTRPMLKEIGIDPDKDVEWIPIGEGGPAGKAIHDGRVDAMGFWDGSFARIEIAGFPLRYLQNSPGVQRLFGNSFSVRKSQFAANKDTFTRFFRGMAKSSVFAVANPEASIKLAWEVFPESMPKGKSDQEALSEALKIVNSRKDKWLPGPFARDKRWGAQSKEEWEDQVAFNGLQAEVKDVTPFFTNELTEAVNAFDAAAIERMAKAWKA